MYIGIKNYEYKKIKEHLFVDMYWENDIGCSYCEKLSKFLSEIFTTTSIERFAISNLIKQIFENVHDHGSRSCRLTFGSLNENYIFEIYEENGSFDFENFNLRNQEEEGGAGYRAIESSKWKVSHSFDGKSTFILLSN